VAKAISGAEGSERKGRATMKEESDKLRLKEFVKDL